MLDTRRDWKEFRIRIELALIWIRPSRIRKWIYMIENRIRSIWTRLRTSSSDQPELALFLSPGLGNKVNCFLLGLPHKREYKQKKEQKIEMWKWKWPLLYCFYKAHFKATNFKSMNILNKGRLLTGITCAFRCIALEMLIYIYSI